MHTDKFNFRDSLSMAIKNECRFTHKNPTLSIDIFAFNLERLQSQNTDCTKYVSDNQHDMSTPLQIRLRKFVLGELVKTCLFTWFLPTLLDYSNQSDGNIERGVQQKKNEELNKSLAPRSIKYQVTLMVSRTCIV